jgi:integrase
MANMKKSRRMFGSIRKRQSGCYEASYWHEGVRHSQMFTSVADASAYLSGAETDVRRGGWVDPKAGQVTLTKYANDWLSKRHDLSVRTKELYRYLLDRHIFPTFGAKSISSITTSSVRSWQAAIAKDHQSTAAKAYRLLRAILNTAVADEALVKNPCRVKGGGAEKAPERPVATIPEVQALADAMPESQRIAVLLAAWCQLRRGELLGLRRRDVDLLRGTVTVRTTLTKTMAGNLVEKAPTTESCHRTVAVPGNVLAALTSHLNTYVGPEPGDLILGGGYRSLRTGWDNARRVTGLSYHLHDLRHFGLTMAAATGATTAELMHRAGHASPQAALRYQHATEDRDRVLAEALEALAAPAPVVPIRPMTGASN